MLKKIAGLVLIFIALNQGMAQEITGEWSGELQVKKTTIRLVFHIIESGHVLTATLDSPDQKAFGIPVTEITFENPILKLKIDNARIEYVAELIADSLAGSFTQAGQSFPLVLRKQKMEVPTLVKRYQEPELPYPYVSEDITFRNKQADITLAGTLTMPSASGKHPAVVLITGSGPQNRDEELLGHKPYLVISDYLTRKGIAVLRFDDRGVGQSGGIFETATSFDFATDVKAAIDYLKTRTEIDSLQIGLIGHSEGGIIAPIVASQHPGEVQFIVMLAGTGLPGYQIILMQQELISRAMGLTEEEIEKNHALNKLIFDKVLQSDDTEALKIELMALLSEIVISDSIPIPEGMTADDFISVQVNQVVSPWMLNFLTYDPSTALEKVSCPVLALNGEKDLQVPPKENLQAIKQALERGGNKQVKLIEFPGLNHLFQQCDTGAPEEYEQIEETFSPIALSEIATWIMTQFPN